MSGADPWLTLAQAVWLAGLLSTAGALLFVAMEPAAAGMRAQLARPILFGLALAGVGWVAWLAAQAAAMSDADSLAEAARAVPMVLRQTEFGHIAVLQLALLVIAGVIWRAGRRFAVAAALLAFAAAGLQVGHLHAWAIEGGVGMLTLSALLHIWAASAWLGSLLPLWVLVRGSRPVVCGAAMKRFTWLGTVCVLVLAATALFQGTLLVGGTASLFGTSYGQMALTKVLLFAILVAFAVRNRFQLVPGLFRSNPLSGQRALVRSIGIETVVGVAIVFAAALLSSLPPGISAGSATGE